MRRATLLALAVLPSLAAAQTITFSQDPDNDTVRGKWISKDECDSAAAVEVILTWTFSATVPTGATYQAWAANQEHTGTACSTASSGTLVVGSVGNEELASIGTQTKTYLASGFLAPFAATVDCTTANFPIYVCIQGKDSGGTAFGLAKGTITLSTTRPGTPTGLGAGIGDGALLLSWTEPAGSPAAYDYRIEAVPADPSLPTVQKSGIRVTDYRLDGLANDVAYTVGVWAVSEAGNESASPVQTTETPRPVDDFWDAYRNGPCDAAAPCPGREQGGCGAGGTGPLALLGLAALLAALRRRA
jgi:hypothetical protein